MSIVDIEGPEREPEEAKPATHVLNASFHGGDLYSAMAEVTCLNDPTDRQRDCKFTESDPVNDCPEHVQRVEQLDEDRDWEALGGPYECGGWNWEGTHVHPDDGCGIKWFLDYVGAESIAIGKTRTTPAHVRVKWTGDGNPELHDATPAYEFSSRGFKHLIPVEGTYADSVRVYESSSAFAPHVWLAVQDRVEETAHTAHLTMEGVDALIAQLQWLRDHHYQQGSS